MPTLPLLLALLATAPLRPDHSRVVVASHDSGLEATLNDALRRAGFTVLSGRPMVVGKPMSPSERAKQPIDTSRADILVRTEAAPSGQLTFTAERVKSRQDILRWASGSAPAQAAGEFAAKLQEALRKPTGVIKVDAQGINDAAALEALTKVFDAAGAKVLTSTLTPGARANLTVQYPGPPDELFGNLVSASAPAFKKVGVNDMGEDSLSITLTRAAP